MPRLIVDDATCEKLGMMLDEQGGRIASMSPEGGVFDLMAGLYSKNGIPQFGVYLMGHSGDDLIIGSGLAQFRVRRAAGSDVRVRDAAAGYSRAGRPMRPFAGGACWRRFLYAAPQSWIGRREIAAAGRSGRREQSYRQLVRALAEFEGEVSLQLAPRRGRPFEAWEAEIEAMLGTAATWRPCATGAESWPAQRCGWRACCIAWMHGPAGEIDGRQSTAAIEIARYLIPHAEAVLNMMQAQEGTADDDARYVLRWIERHGRREFTKSEAQHHGKRRFPKADDIDPALAELTRRGYIRPEPAETTGPGRPPSPAYLTNPAVFSGITAEKRSHNSQNWDEESEEDVFGNIGSASEQVDSADRVQVKI